MKSVLKILARTFCVPIIRILGYIFFSKNYLTGRHFDGKALIGWYWVWRSIWLQKILGFNRMIPFPVSIFITISNPRNLIFHPDDINNFQHFGCYFQNFDGKIVIGRGTYIAPNVGIITANHDPVNPSKHLKGQDVVIGENCWIGMNSVILPGVILGDNTVVAAGAVVTKSFAEGYCVVGGVPARFIRHTNRV